MKKASITEAKNRLSSLIDGLKRGSPVFMRLIFWQRSTILHARLTLPSYLASSSSNSHQGLWTALCAELRYQFSGCQVTVITVFPSSSFHLIA